MGFHQYPMIQVKQEATRPPAGPFDPRTEAERTAKETIFVCARCGEEFYDSGCDL
jgi:hypothetical protein